MVYHCSCGLPLENMEKCSFIFLIITFRTLVEAFRLSSTRVPWGFVNWSEYSLNDRPENETNLFHVEHYYRNKGAL